MKDKAKKLIEKYEELESELGNPEVLADQARYNKIHKQYKGIEKAVAKAKEYLQMLNDQEEWKAALGDSDPEMVAMAKSELSDIEKKLPGVTDELQILSPFCRRPVPHVPGLLQPHGLEDDHPGCQRRHRGRL